MIWDKRVFEKMDVMVGQFSVNVLLRGVVDGFVWACIGVYGPNDDGQGLLCGRSCQGCVTGGPWHGAW